MLDAAVRRVPITGGVERVSAPEGSRLAEFVAIAFPLEAHRRFVVASIDGEEVAPEAWDRVPRAGETVQLAFRPGGKDFFRTLLQIAVIAVAVWVGGGGLGGWFAAGTWQAAVAAAGVSILGNLAINTLIPLPKPGTIEAPPPYYSLSTARNSSRPWGVVPMLFGTHRIAAPRMSEPFQEVLGGVTYLRVALCLGLCPMSVTDWKIGETALSEFDGVEMEVRLNETDPAHTLITGDPAQEAVGATLNHTDWTVRTTATDVDEIEVIYDFPSGLGGLDSKGRKTARTINLRLQYRPTGSSEDWTDWRPTVPQANDASAGAGVPYRPEYFTTEGDLIAWRGQLAGMGGVAGDIVPVTRSDPGRALRHSERFAVPRGQYDVRTQRVEAASTDPNIVDAVSWGILGSIRSQADPFPNRKLATACFRIKATDQLSNMVDTLNCIASSLQPVFSDDALEDPTIASAAEFTDVEASSNPAVLALLAARGPNAAFPKPDAEIDWPAWASAAAKATARGLTFNEYVETSIGRWEMVRRILAAMHARPVKHMGKLSVVVDDSKAGQPPAQTFTPRNVRNFRWQKTFPRLPHAIRTPFANADNGWQADEVTVFMPGQTAETATRYETVAMPGKTNADEIRTVVNQYARNGHYQTESFEFETDAEHLTVKRGDYCVVQHFAMATGLGAARIRTRETNGGGDVTAIVLDRPVETPVGESLAVQWRTIVADSGLARMEVLGEQAVTRDAANPKRFVFTTPQSGDTKPAASGADYEGDIALVGIAGKVSFEVLVRDIAPRPHLQAAISCVAYAGERFVDAPTWPAHDPKVTRPYAPRPSAPTDAVPIASTLQIAVGFTQPPMPTGVELTGYRVARRESGSSGDSWEPLGPLGRDERIAIAPAGEPGADYDIRIIAVGVRDDGVTVYSDALIAAGVSAVTAPAAPAGCGGAFTTRTSSGGAQQLVLTATWTANENPDVLDTVVEQRISTGPDVWQEIGRGAAAAGRTEIHGLPVGRAYILGFTNISKRGAPSTRTAIASITAPDTLVATGALTAAPGGALDDALDDLISADAAISSAIDAAEDRLDGAESELDLQGTAIGSLETITDGHAASISGLQAITKVGVNRIPNGGLARPFVANEAFSYSAGRGTESIHASDWVWDSAVADGPRYWRTAPGSEAWYWQTPFFRVYQGEQVTVAATVYRPPGGGTVNAFLSWFEDDGDYIGNSTEQSPAFTPNMRDRQSVTSTAPTNTRMARLVIQGDSSTPAGYYEITRTKAEAGAVATIWSDEGDALDARASIIEVETVQADHDSAIATLDSRLDVAESDIDGVTGDVTTLTAANLITRMAAVDGGSASAKTLAQIEAQTAGAYNLIPNSTGAIGLRGWTALQGAWQAGSAINGNASPFLSRLFTGATTGSYDRFVSDPIYVGAGVALSFAGEWYLAGIVAGSVDVAVRAYNSSHVEVTGFGGAGQPYATRSTSVGFQSFGEFLNRTTPPGTSYVRIEFAMASAQGDAGYAEFAFRRLMLNVGATLKAWNDQASFVSTSARIAEVETVTSDHDSAIATLDSRLDAAEIDVDGLQSTASNHTTRLAAIDGGSTSATSIAQLAAKTTPRQNLMPHPSGYGTYDPAAELGWTAGGGDASGSGLYQQNWAPYGGAIYQEDWASGYSSGSHRYYLFTIPVTSHGSYVVSFEGQTYGLTGVVASIKARDGGSDVAYGATAAFGAGRVAAVLTAPSGTDDLQIVVDIPPQTVGGYCNLNFWQIKVESGTVPTTFTNDAQAFSLKASITEVESVNSDQDSTIAVIDSRMDAAEIDIDGVQSTASNLSSRMTAVDDGSTVSMSLNALNARTLAPRENLVKNSTFMLGFEYWTQAGSWGVGYGPDVGQFIYAGGDDRYIISDEFPIYAGATYTFSLNAGGASFDGGYAVLGWYDSSHTFISYGDFKTIAAGVGYPRLSETDVAPTGAAYARLQVGAGDLNGGFFLFYKTKVESGSIATVWSDERAPEIINASVVENAEAIADEVSARAAFQTTAEADIGDLQGSVTAQGSAIADIEDGLDLAYIIRLSGGDNEVSIEAALGGASPSGVITLKANQVAVAAAALLLGDNTIFEDEYNTFYTESGGERFRFGGPFGAAGNLFMWRGSAIVDLNTETKANSKFAILVDEDLPAVDGGTITTPTIDDATKTGTADFNNVTTSGTTVHTLATIDLTVGASGYLELLSPLFMGGLSINQESGMTLSAGTDWFGQMLITEQLQSGGTEHTLWTIPLQISDTGGGLFDFIFDPPVQKVVAQNVSGASRYRIKLQRTSGSNNVSGNGLQGRFTIRRTP